ncbi:hypothetical protein YC2023_031657 [Brassica napus]
MAPEYALYGQFSVKTDVFSFGVLVIEIITGKRSNNGGSNDDEDSENLLTWVSIQNQTGMEKLERRHYQKCDRPEFKHGINKRDLEVHTHWSAMCSRESSD